MKLEDIEAFVEVVRAQSISEAANRLGLTQPAITRRIQSLEAALGAELLDRATKPPRPNALGQRLVEPCRTVLRDVEALSTLAGAPRATAARLRIGVTQGLADAAITQALPAVREHFPQLDVQLATAWGQTLVRQVEAGELDAAMAWMETPRTFPRAIEAAPCGRTTLAVVAPRGSTDALAARARRRRLTLADLAGAAWVLNPDGCGFREGLRRALAAQGLALNVRLDTFGQDTQLELVAQGHGLGLVPMPLLVRSPIADRVEILELTDFHPHLALWCLRPAVGAEAAAEALGCFARAISAALPGTVPAAPPPPRRRAAAS